MAARDNGQQPWWQQAVVYQIAPLSFQDSDGDGKGDLRGIIERVPYLEWLGIDAVWLCPIYPSPMLDFGYDISDYCNVDPLFGSLTIFDKLLAKLHARASDSCSTSCQTTLPRSIPGLSRAAPRGRAQSAIGMYGPTRQVTVVPQTTG